MSVIINNRQNLENEIVSGVNYSKNKAGEIEHLTIPCRSFVSCVQFSPYEWCKDVLVYESNGCLNFLQLNSDENEFDYKEIDKIVVGIKCSAISFSPETNLMLLNKTLKFAAAGIDKLIRIYASTVKPAETASLSILRGHEGFINDLVFDPHNGETLASVADDCVCCLWSVKEVKLISKLQLTSPGRNVEWHSSEPNKVICTIKLKFKLT